MECEWLRLKAKDKNGGESVSPFTAEIILGGVVCTVCGW